MNGIFLVRSCFKLAYKAEPINIPSKNIWFQLTPFKVIFFVWMAILGTILTLDNLVKRGFYLPNICLLCYEDEDNIPLSIDLLSIFCRSMERNVEGI